MSKSITKILFLFILFISVSFQVSIPQIRIPDSKTSSKKTSLQQNQTHQVIHSLNALPMYFIENNGQVNESVKYHVKMRNMNAYFAPGEIVYQFIKSKEEVKAEDRRLEQEKRSIKARIESIRMRFMGAREDVEIEGLKEREAKMSFFRGNDPQKWIKGARSYERILYKELYPHIDLAVFGGEGKIKHEYRVRAGGNVSDIAIRYEGAKRLRLNEGGELEIETEDGMLREGVPLSYQMIDGKRINVKAEYIMDTDNTIRFQVEEYRKNKVLIIDPYIGYSTYLGGVSDDTGYDIKTRFGAYYITGGTYSWDFPTYVGLGYDVVLDGEYDAFVTKLNAAGTGLVYSTFLGGSSHDNGTSIAIDISGNAYVHGNAASKDFPTTSGAYDINHNGVVDVFVTKLNAAGTDLLYSTLLGGVKSDFSRNITIDISGNAYVVGYTHSDDFPTTPGAFDTGFNGISDAFVTKLNAAGTGLVYSTFLGGSNYDLPSGIAIDGGGNAFVTGSTLSKDFPTNNAYDAGLTGESDVFITKLNSTGSALSYSTYLGGSGIDNGYHIALDGSGNAYVTGSTTSTDFPTFGYDTSYNGGEYDAFVAKLNPLGSSLVYSTFLGGSNSDTCLGIAIDGSGNAYVAGYTGSTDFPTGIDYRYSDDRSYNGSWDAFVTKLSSSGGSLAYSTYLGGSKSDKAWGITVDVYGDIYVTGQTWSNDFPTLYAYDEFLTGESDVFITKILTSIRPPIFHFSDFNGDDSSDPGTFRPSNGTWHLPFFPPQRWGAPGDIPANGDYNLDGKTDIAVWRPSKGAWYIKDFGVFLWGTPGDIPVPGDYNGDGRTDLAVWRPSNGRWYIKTLDGKFIGHTWGKAGDIPVPADYNGDDTTDIAVWRPSNGMWYLKGIKAVRWGKAGDIPVPADYGGKGKSYTAVWRPSNGAWYIRDIGVTKWGMDGDIPTPGDYNGDGTTDIAVWRPVNGRWYIRGIGGYTLGMMGDIPLVR